MVKLETSSINIQHVEGAAFTAQQIIMKINGTFLLWEEI
jgi:hypothetical protein